MVGRWGPWSLALATALTMTTPRIGVAQDERARLHFDAGASYFEEGAYEDALREFQRAYELSDRPELFYNYSLCYERLGQLEPAVRYLDRFLREASSVPRRERLELRLGNLRTRLAEEQAATEEAGAAPAESTTVPVGIDEREGESASGGGVSPLALVGFAVAGAGLVTAAVAGGLALAERGDLEDRGCGTSVDCGGDAASSLRLRAAFADVGMGLALVGATLGVVFLFVGSGESADAPREPEDRAALRFTPFFDASGGGGALRGSF